MGPNELLHQSASEGVLPGDDEEVNGPNPERISGERVVLNREEPDSRKRQRGTGVGAAARSLEEEEDDDESPKDDVRAQTPRVEVTKK